MGRTGVLLLNLGGPDKLEDVRPFLYNLFADPEIIRLPSPLLQAPLAWLISTLRAGKSQENYKKIGGGSPLRRITEEQAQAMRDRLKEMGHDVSIYVGMRYWHPFTEEAVAEIKRDKIDKVIILPLYPQFSISTSGSSFRLLEQLWNSDPDLKQVEYTVIPSWYDFPGYLQTMAQLIGKRIDSTEDPDNAHVFFSAHGVPVSYVEEAGDPYRDEMEACTSAIMKTLNRPNNYTLAYQSRVGPVEWLQPYTDEAIEDLAEKGVAELVVVPVSFVSEHIETLEEIDMEYREVAEEAGIKNFARVPAPDTDPTFIQALSDLVLQAMDSPKIAFGDTIRPAENTKLYPQEKWEWGMTNSAEIWNGRLAMVGLLAIIYEMLTGHGLLHAIGLLG
ncbi:ferrochelatase [filamentous cyanobacterium LEGE 11480]|uniref:Ferrochelatase n=1 Tax=Romeriopsis navalis LEGE 11480 TaxID=2777977 RepID=A0A928VT26_9CYAN|nr:ferrochelatase [Romeriopsis navalis]MBE9032032.1 ferrochelatase [Romeriopsis navalis LEGE 11480]